MVTVDTELMHLIVFVSACVKVFAKYIGIDPMRVFGSGASQN